MCICTGYVNAATFNVLCVQYVSVAITLCISKLLYGHEALFLVVISIQCRVYVYSQSHAPLIVIITLACCDVMTPEMVQSCKGTVLDAMTN